VGLRLALVQLVDLDRGAQRAVVDQRHVGLRFRDRRLEAVEGDVGRQDLEPLVVAQQRAQPVGDEIRELAQEEGDHGFTLHLTPGYPAVHPASSPEDRPPEGMCDS
jgi:hypothetical protein